MQIFITGTGTCIGKTVISAWLCYHFGYDYWKPIQAGTLDSTDSDFVKTICPSVVIHNELYKLSRTLSPHIAAKLEGIEINLDTVKTPKSSNLIIEGAGGVMVPINDKEYVIDLIKKLSVGVMIVAKSTLGTINHTCLTVNALKSYNIPILGIIMNGPKNSDNRLAIEKYAKVEVLDELPQFENFSVEDLRRYKPSPELCKLKM